MANNNERRRMQHINKGFDALRALLPASTSQERMSKVGFSFWRAFLVDRRVAALRRPVLVGRPGTAARRLFRRRAVLCESESEREREGEESGGAVQEEDVAAGRISCCCF